MLLVLLETDPTHQIFRHIHGVLNKIYLQNFLHRWAINHETNLMNLLKTDSSSDLKPICIKSFVNRFYLILQISKIPLQKKFATKLNTALDCLVPVAKL